MNQFQRDMLLIFAASLITAIPLGTMLAVWIIQPFR